MWDVLTPAVLITGAAGLTGLGYLVINQMSLRIMMLAGSAFYIAYYATVADVPLWGAIFTSSGLMLANLTGMAALTARRFQFTLPAEYADIYPRFDILNPGDFRLVMKQAERITTHKNTVITVEGAPVEHLTFVIDGSMHIAKSGAEFPLPSDVFVGEVAYLLGSNSAATTTLHEGSQVIRWNLEQLRATSARNPRLKLAIDAMLSRDLARKVALAVAGPDAQRA